jgi:hypothetical protein
MVLKNVDPVIVIDLTGDGLTGLEHRLAAMAILKATATRRVGLLICPFLTDDGPKQTPRVVEQSARDRRDLGETRLGPRLRLSA